MCSCSTETENCKSENGKQCGGKKQGHCNCNKCECNELYTTFDDTGIFSHRKFARFLLEVGQKLTGSGEEIVSANSKLRIFKETSIGEFDDKNKCSSINPSCPALTGDKSPILEELKTRLSACRADPT